MMNIVKTIIAKTVIVKTKKAARKRSYKTDRFRKRILHETKLA